MGPESGVHLRGSPSIVGARYPFRVALEQHGRVGMAKLASDVVRIDSRHQVDGREGMPGIVGDPSPDAASLQGGLEKPKPLAFLVRPWIAFWRAENDASVFHKCVGFLAVVAGRPAENRPPRKQIRRVGEFLALDGSRVFPDWDASHYSSGIGSRV
jgi:hypothetical protein